jgi:uncharacterized protein
VSRTIIDGDYEWDAEKDASNQRKHGVAFFEAASALAQPSTVVFDEGSSSGRYLALGVSRYSGALLAVIFEVRGTRERIISARRPTKEERKLYMRGG